MATCPKCGSHRIRRRHTLVGTVIHAVTRQRRFSCSVCGWRGWRGHEFSDRPRRASDGAVLGVAHGRPGELRMPADAPPPPNTLVPRPGERYRRSQDRNSRLRRQMWRVTGGARRETPRDVLKAVLIVLVLLGVFWGGSQACSVMRPAPDPSAQQ